MSHMTPTELRALRIEAANAVGSLARMLAVSGTIWNPTPEQRQEMRHTVRLHSDLEAIRRRYVDGLS